ncbi:MAG TPA: sulfotransferase domain-containing protein [Thermoanaerobaculia bacterium]
MDKASPSRPLKSSLYILLARPVITILLLLRGWIERVLWPMNYRLRLAEWYRPRPDDTFIVSFPKSGTTLMQMILHQLTTEGEMDFVHIEQVSPWFEIEIGRGNAREILERPSPRIFKSHAKRSMLPRTGRFIYIVRDPGDVALSSYHHHCLVTGRQHDLSRYVDLFLADRTRFGSWFDHFESWWPHRNSPDVLFLTFEELTRNLEATIRRVAAFCGLEIDEAQMPRILERCGIDFMKQHEEKFDPRLGQITPYRGAFIRQGRAGQGAKALEPRQKEQLALRLAAMSRKLGGPSEDYASILRSRSA